MNLVEKARAGRLAALQSLVRDADQDQSDNVVSIFDFGSSEKAQSASPFFRSIRVIAKDQRLAA